MYTFYRMGLAALLLLVVAALSVACGEGDGTLSPGATGGLTVSAIGSVTVSADEAYVVVVSEQPSGSSGPEQMSIEDRTAIRENLADLGIDESAVEFVGVSVYLPGMVLVELEPAEVLEMGPQVVDAIEEVASSSEVQGVRYTLSEESCDHARSLARREAILSTEKAAADLAEAFGVGVGSVTAVLEDPLGGITTNYPGFDADSCRSATLEPYAYLTLYASLVPFDSEQEVGVSVGLEVTYNIQ